MSGIEHTANRELHPAWASQKRIDLFCSGVLYGIEGENALWLAKHIDRIWNVYGAMGPVLVHQDPDGAWMPYDDDTIDAANDEVKLRERDFPWNLGDIVAVLGLIQGLPVLIDFRHPELGGISYAYAWSTIAVQQTIRRDTIIWLTKENGIRHIHEHGAADPRLLALSLR